MFAAAMVRVSLKYLSPVLGVLGLMFYVSQLAGNIAKLPAKDLNYMALDYLAARVLYTAVYMGVKSEIGSYLRTGIWAWSVSIPIWVLVRAGKAVNAGDAL